MTYAEALESRRAPSRLTPEHEKWHRLFGNDCRLPDCPKRAKETKS